MAARTIAVAVADPAERGALAGQLRTGGFAAAPIGAPTVLWPDPHGPLAEAEADALLLDAGPGGLDGAAICAKLRRGGALLPILVLHDGGDGIVQCLNAGASDGLARPARPLELAARLRAQLRHHGVGGDAVLEVGPYRFHPDRRELAAPGGGRAIRLTAIEALILRFLHAAGGRTVPRQVLLYEVWGYRGDVSTHTVETHIYRLRRKIEPEPGRRRLVLSEEAGYRLDLAWRGPPRALSAVPLRALA